MLDTEREKGPLDLAQEAKKAVVVESQTVRLSKQIAALAFGVSVVDFDRLKIAGKILVIEPKEDTVQVSLQPEIGTWRDLWQEVLSSLEKGRSSVSKARKEYEERYQELQRLAPSILEEETILRQLNLCGLWVMLPPATKRELSDISPGNVLRAIAA